jgi:two-component system response regulator MprA
MALRSAGIASPVLFLTARDGLHDKVAGFAAGGDDYLTKPFDLDEVKVRNDALLRRSEHVPTSVHHEPWLDSARHALIVGTTSATLTPTEFRLLGRLMAAPGVPARRPALVAAGWPHGESVSNNTLDSYVRRLRIKLEGARGRRDQHGPRCRPPVAVSDALALERRRRGQRFENGCRMR